MSNQNKIWFFIGAMFGFAMGVIFTLRITGAV